MCFSAIHWARIEGIVYGTGIKDVKGLGFNELSIGNTRMKAVGKSRVKIFPGFLRDECRQLLRDWDKLKNKVLY